jgi:hypothetical protein
MPKSLRRDALHLLTLAIVFLAFFEYSKHAPAIAQVNPFAEDPYDAIGSFSVQLAMVLAVLSCIRAFRRRADAATMAERALLARGNLLCAGAILLTFLADAIAMARHSALWGYRRAGLSLCILLGLLILGSSIELVRAWRTAEQLELLAKPVPWRSLTATFAAVAVTLAAYPEEWRRSVPGALLTVVAGMALLFMPLRLLAEVIVLDRTGAADALDDLIAFCRCPHDRHLKLLFSAANWLRRYWWSFIILTGAAIGAFLAHQELSSPGVPVDRVVLVAATYIGIESCAVLMGALLFSQPLRLI